LFQHPRLPFHSSKISREKQQGVEPLAQLKKGNGKRIPEAVDSAPTVPFVRLSSKTTPVSPLLITTGWAGILAAWHQ
jgi:hypothetical protein